LNSGKKHKITEEKHCKKTWIYLSQIYVKLPQQNDLTIEESSIYTWLKCLSQMRLLDCRLDEQKQNKRKQKRRKMVSLEGEQTEALIEFN
jgi:hypothetical protein